MAIKKSSSDIQISAGLAETAANTFTQLEVDLSLSPLDNEVFVVTAVDLDIDPPDAITATNTQTKAYVSTTSLTSAQGIDNSNDLTASKKDIRAAGFADGGAAFDQQGLTAPEGMTGIIGIIATIFAYFLFSENITMNIFLELAIKLGLKYLKLNNIQAII